LLALTWLAPAAGDTLHTVRSGDTLIGLAGTYTKQQGNWQKIQALNHIADPRKIPTGIKLRIPVNLLKSAQTALAQLGPITGDCELLSANGVAAQPAKTGMELHSGDTVRTGADGTASVEFADGSRLLVRAQSRLIVEGVSLSRNSKTMDVRLRLEQGSADSQVTPAPAGASPHFRITTPAAVAAVRGTNFRVDAEVNGGGAMRNETLQGAVDVGNAAGHRLVPAGYGVVVSGHEAPSEAHKLLPAPNLVGLPKLVEKFPLDFAWTAQAEAASYRVQIADNPHFAGLRGDHSVKLAKADLGVLPDGDYVLRVRAVDAAGLEGFDSIHAFTLNARPDPPHLVSPEEGGEVLSLRPAIHWAIPETAERYHLQLSSSRDFNQPLRDLPALGHNAWEADSDLPPGRYFWRVAALDEHGDQGPYGEIHSFTLQAPPKAP
jgi:hypothetical protein